MSSALVACPSCRTVLPGAACAGPQFAHCPGCNRPIHVDVFPALFRTPEKGRHAEAVVESGVSSCFYHDKKKAVVPCDNCGRFLCALCDVDLNGRHFCPNCIQIPQATGPSLSLQKSRAVPDTAALFLAVFPLIIFPLTVLTAPAAFVYAILSFRRPTSLVPRSRIRAYVALALSVTQMIVWISLFVGSMN